MMHIPDESAVIFVMLLERMIYWAHRAHKDPLTGCWTRRGLHFFAAMSIAQGEHGHLFTDIDHFKQLNTSHGHGVADRVLVELGRLLRKVSPPGTHWARWGGEEFVGVVPLVKKASVLGFAQRLRQRIRRHDFGLPERVTVSIALEREAA